MATDWIVAEPVFYSLQYRQLLCTLRTFQTASGAHAAV